MAHSFSTLTPIGLQCMSSGHDDPSHAHLVGLAQRDPRRAGVCPDGDIILM